MSNIEQGQQSKSFTKKLYCSEHGNKFTFKCGYEHCPTPFLCVSPSCLDEHFHQENQGKLVLYKFDSTEYTRKFTELQKVLTKEDFASEAKVLKSFIDDLKSSMICIFKEYKQLQNRKEAFSSEIRLESGLMEKVDETIGIGHNLRRSLDTLKSKVNLSLASIVSPSTSPNPSQSPLIAPIHIENNSQNLQIEQIQADKSIPITEAKNTPPFQKPQGNKVNFEQLFSTSPKTFTSQKVSILRTVLQGQSNKNHNFGKLSAPSTPNQVPTNETISNSQTPSLKKDSVAIQNLKIYERDFFMKKELTMFLQQRINNFSWGLCQEIHSSYLPFKPVERFHEMLQGRRNLLFIFIGDNRILGSFYPSRYPRLVQRLRNDSNSFLFISDDQNQKILQFRAVASEFHLAVSDRLHICHGNTPSYADGIRTIQRNLNQLNFCLPSVSYKSPEDGKMDKQDNESTQGKCFSGFLKVKEFFVLQVFTEDNGTELD